MRHGSGEAVGFSPADFAQGIVVFAYLVNAAIGAGPQDGGMATARKIFDDDPTDDQVRGILAAAMASSSPLLSGGDKVLFGGEVPDVEGAEYAQEIVRGLYGEDRMNWLAKLEIDEMFWRALPFFLVAVAGAVVYYADTESDEPPEGIFVMPMPEDES